MLWNSLENPTEDNTGGVFNSILFSFTHSPAVKIIDSDVDLSFVVAFTNRDYKGDINVSMDNINLSEPGLLHIQRISNIGLHPTMVSLPDSFKYEINDDITITIRDEVYSTQDYHYINMNMNWRNNLVDENILIEFDSEAIGDTIAWIQSCENFRLTHNCNLFVKSKRDYLFKKSYPNINFIDEYKEKEFYNIIELSWKKELNGRSCSLQEKASRLLNIPFDKNQSDTKIDYEISDRPNDIPSGKYVCISTQSTAQAKFWNCKDGWETIVEYLNGIGYHVVCIDRFKQFGISDYMNQIPSNCIDKTEIKSEFGNLDGVTKYLQHCDFFIGLGSGLSWLSWAMKIPTILISNFSPPWYEFQTNVVRVYKDSPVSGYFTKYLFDPGNWNWCPIQEINSMQDWYDLEQITPDDVIDSIDECVVTLLK